MSRSPLSALRRPDRVWTVVVLAGAAAIGLAGAAIGSQPRTPAPAQTVATQSYEISAEALVQRTAGLDAVIAALPAKQTVAASDEHRRRIAAGALRQAAFELNSARERACQAGLSGRDLCAAAFAPAWLGEPTAFAPPREELERRAVQLAVEVGVLANVVCRTDAGRDASVCHL